MLYILLRIHIHFWLDPLEVSVIERPSFCTEIQNNNPASKCLFLGDVDFDIQGISIALNPGANKLPDYSHTWGNAYTT